MIKPKKDKQKKKEGRKRKLNESVIFLEKINEQKHQKLEEMSMLSSRYDDNKEEPSITDTKNILDELKQTEQNVESN